MLTKSFSSKFRKVKIFVFLFVQKILDLIYFFNINIPSNKESEIISLLKKYSFFHFHVAQLLKFVSSFYPLKVNTYKTDFCKGFFFYHYTKILQHLKICLHKVYIYDAQHERETFSAKRRTIVSNSKVFALAEKRKVGSEVIASKDKQTVAIIYRNFVYPPVLFPLFC